MVQSNIKRGGKNGKRVSVQKNITHVIDDLKEEEKHEALYLHGFTDPHRGARGPSGNVNNPTNIAVLQGVITMQIGPNEDVDHYRAYAGIPRDSFDYNVNANGDVAIVVRPHAIAYAEPTGSSSATYGTSLNMGFTWDPDIALDQVVYPNTTTGTEATRMPLDTFSMGCRGGWDINTNTVDAVELETTHSVPFRCVGLRTTLTVNQPAYHAQGTVFAFDNMDLYVKHGVRPNAFIERTDASGQVSAKFVDNTMGNDIEQVKFGLQPVHYRRSDELGTFRNGATYECTWLPCHDGVLDFHTKDACAVASNAAVSPAPDGDPGGSGVYLNRALGLMATGAANIFVLRGLNTTDSLPLITIGVTYAIEYGVDIKGPLGWALNTAQYVPRFLPDWNELQRVRPGGACGASSIGFSGTAHGVLAAAIRHGAVSHPQGVRPRAIHGAKKPKDDELRKLERATTSAAGVAAAVKYGPKAKGFFGRLVSGIGRIFKGGAKKITTVAEEDLGPALEAGAEEATVLL